MNYRYIRNGAAVLLAFNLCQPAAAEEQKNKSEEAALGREVVVSATRVEQDADEVPVTITTVDSERIEREQPTDLEDLLRYEAGVSVRSQTNRASGVFRAVGRGGNEGINIRGLEGNQVLLQVDGVRLPASWASGPFAAGRGDYIDPEAYKRVEILRGPSSTQFGSDGLAGAVQFLTKDPSDLLTLGQPVQGAVKLGYSSADNSWALVPSLAFKTDTLQGMVLASLRRGHETDTKGTNDVRNVNRTTPNPSDKQSDYVLAKLVISPSRTHEFKLTAESLDRHNDTEVYSFFGDPFAAATLTGVSLKENITRELFKLDYKYTDSDNPWFQVVTASFWHQDSKNQQIGIETRSAQPVLRTRDTQYAEGVSGLSLQLESNFGEGVTHRLVYGFDTSLTDITSMKQGFNSAAPAFVPNKSFPDTNYRLTGAFIQDEIGFGSLSIIPGVRFDRFEMTPKSDSYFALSNNQAQPLSGSEVSPKLGAIWKLSPLASVFAQYAHGFLAPTPNQVNGGVSNLTATPPYIFTGNPNLKPEKSDSVELGIRGRTNTLRYSASVFHSKYKDFIDGTATVGGAGTIADPVRFQAINLKAAEISGFEARADWAFRRDWTASASYSHTKGDSSTNGVSTPLDTIDPDKLILGVRYDEENRFGGQIMATLVKAKDRNPNPANYTPGGYQVVDVSGWYNFDKRTSLNAGVFNLFDKKYYEWADVRDIAANYAALDAFSQPGRNFSVSIKHQF